MKFTPTIRHTLALSVVSLAFVVSACTPPATGTPTPTTAPPVTTPATYKEGRCTSTEGVTVVVDHMPFQDTVIVRCALGPQVSGFAALDDAAVAHDPGRYPGTVCQLDGLPVQGHPFCWSTGGYWSYWRAPVAGAAWKYSEWGAGAGPALGAGSVEGWHFVLFSDAAATPPRAGTAGPVVP